VLNFIILALVIFVMIKRFNAVRARLEATPAAAPPTPEDVLLLREIRDSLKK
jgi:large conductance mechanosensitive channel